MTKAGFLEEESVEMSWIERRREENGCGLRGGKMEWVSGDKGVSAGKEEGRTSKVSIQPPDGESWRGCGRGPLPATMAILGPESNQIRCSPQSPQQLRRTAVPPRALSAGTSLPAPR